MTQELENVFVYENRGRLPQKQIIQKGFRMKYHCEENSYLQSGSISYPAPLCRSGSEFQWIMDYCRSHGISKILVDSLHDIGETPAEVRKVTSTLCANGFQVEVVDCGLTFSLKQETSAEQDEDTEIMMGGM